ncbi:MAG: hypothetical protein JWO06_2593 [Bacteroidota bacterium]|nr:hypothetical protein [Bacteroidota bacterium]
MFKLSRIKTFLSAAIVLSIAAFFIFYRLDANPLYMWDESRLAVNALEMCRSGQWFVTTYRYKPDMWNVKPPLMIILQAMSMKMLGYNELAVRLPSAIAAFSTVILLFAFGIRQLKSRLVSVSAVLFLCTSGGYICMHVSRTGDYDTLLIFFLTAYFLSAFSFINTGKYRYYILFCGFLLLAMLTKGVGGIFFLPGTALMLLFHLKSKSFSLKYLLPVFVVFIGIGAYYLLREKLTPGYVHTVIYEEIRGRMFNENFNTGSPWYYFFKRIVEVHFNPWWILALLSLPVYFISGSTEKKLIAAIWITLVIFWIAISISINKNDWYSAPSFPLLALLSAITFNAGISYFIKNIPYKNVAIGTTLLLIFYFPFIKTISSVYEVNDHFGFAELIKANAVTDNTVIISSRYDPSLDFYQEALAIKGITIWIRPSESVRPGETIITLNNSEADLVQQRFNCNVLYRLKETVMMTTKN